MRHTIKKTNTLVAKPNAPEIGKALADPERVGIIAVLQHAMMSPKELADTLRLEERLVRYHLRVLRQARIVMERGNPYRVLYAVIHPAVASTCRILYELWAEEAQRSASRTSLAL
jgi:DNA-binding transcriptional ArsR family regulator